MLFNWQKFNHPDFPAVVDVLDIDNPVIFNCLVDQVNSLSIGQQIDTSQKCETTVKAGNNTLTCICKLSWFVNSV